MKRCPKCGKTYPDQDINFCLEDGELLSRSGEAGYRSTSGNDPARTIDESPPTVVLDQARITNPIGWNPASAPPVRWQQNQPAVYPFAHSAPSQILPILSLVLGLCGLTVGWCCYSGILFAPAAIIMGIVGLVQQKNNPEIYGGRGLAIGGIATGIAYFVFLAIFVLIYGLALIGGSIS